MMESLDRKLALVAIFGLAFTGLACNSSSSNAPSQVSQGTNVPTGSVLVGHVSLSVLDPSGNLVYSDANPSTALTLTSGIAYDFRLAGTNVPTGTTFTLQATDIDTVNATPSSTTLSLGDNTYTLPSAGDYLLTLSAIGSASTTIAGNSYQASVSCANPTFTASSLTPQGISVSAGSGSNLYNFSAASVTTNANGMAPYLCAWDVDGDGIQDTPFSACGTTVSNIYVNYVGTRNIGLLVKDSCNTSVTVSNSSQLAYTVPAMPGNVFIYGQITNASGTALTDTRVNGVNYLATNSGGFDIVQPSYSPGASGKGTFTINSSLNYGMPSSLPFGMQLDVGNISDTLSVSQMTGTVDASQATLNQLSYVTDQAGDQDPARTLTGSNCVLTNPGAQVKFQQGTPCSAGTTGDNNSADVEVWGNYTCTLSDAAGSSTITGSFDGIAHLADNCQGGGGGGGGGITPIQL